MENFSSKSIEEFVRKYLLGLIIAWLYDNQMLLAFHGELNATQWRREYRKKLNRRWKLTDGHNWKTQTHRRTLCFWTSVTDRQNRKQNRTIFENHDLFACLGLVFIIELLVPSRSNRDVRQRDRRSDCVVQYFFFE